MDFKVGDEVKIKPGGSSTYARNNPGLVSKIRNIKSTGYAASVINLESSAAHGVWDYEIELVLPTNTSYGSQQVVLPKGYTYKAPSSGNYMYGWNNFPGNDGYYYDDLPEEKKPEIKCECGQRTAARDKSEDAPSWHKDYCPVYKKE